MSPEEIRKGVEQVEDLLTTRYGISIADVIDEDIVIYDLRQGEDPLAIVDWIGEKEHLPRIDRNPYSPERMN